MINFSDNPLFDPGKKNPQDRPSRHGGSFTLGLPARGEHAISFILTTRNMFTTIFGCKRDSLGKVSKWAFTTFHSANWHPLTWLSHMLDIQIFGLAPGLMHMVNLLIHLANTFVLFLFLHSATRDFWKSYWVALLFGLHPLHVESVAWVSERKDLLCAFFYFLALYAYTAYAKKPGMAKYVWVLLAFIAGLLSKPMIVTLPFLMLLLDVWPLKRVSFAPSGFLPRLTSSGTVLRNLILEKMPFFMLAVASSLVTISAQKSIGAVGSLELYPFWTRLGNALSAYLWYIEKTAWPACLCFFYPHPGMPGLARLLGSFLFFGCHHRGRDAPFIQTPLFRRGLVLVSGILVPVIGLVQVGSQSMADRLYLYSSDRPSHHGGLGGRALDKDTAG